MGIYVVSDFHLSLGNEKRMQKIISFIDFLIEKKANKIIFAGDTFDIWYDWENLIIKDFFPFYVKLRNLRDNGCKIIFLCGNHDFWFNDFLQKYLDIKIYNKNYKFIFNGKKVFISHGDDYINDELFYKIFKLFLRSPFVKNIFSIIHPQISLNIARLISNLSRKKKRILKREAKLEKSVNKIFNKGYQIVIFGHSHKAFYEKKANGQIYANSGDWIDNSYYLVLQNNSVELKKF